MKKKIKKTNDKQVNFKTSVDAAMDTIKCAIKRRKLTLDDFGVAVGIMFDTRLENEIIGLRETGLSIRDIARKIHVDERKISRVINLCLK